MNKIKARSYTLKTESGGWLGQIVLTSDGMFSGVTDYGNLSYAWRSFGDKDFREFVIGLQPDYFAGKLYSGINHIAFGKKVEQSCKLFADKILPELKKVLELELLAEDPNF